MGPSDHKIYFEVCDENLTPFGKATAFTAAEIAVELHRHHYYRVSFNDNPKYPLIIRIVAEIPPPSVP